MKTHMPSLCIAVSLCANAFAQDPSCEAVQKQASDATRYTRDIANVAAPTDLDFDSNFGIGGGTQIYDFNSGIYTRDWGMRTFYRSELDGSAGGIPVFRTFRYVAGVHWHNGTWDVAIGRTDPATGLVATSTVFPSGKLTLQTTLTEAQDVAFDGNRRLYFTGQSSLFLFGNAFTTFCFDIDTGAACAGFASGSTVGYSYTVFDAPDGDAGRLGSIAHRIVFDPAGYLFIGGESNLSVGMQLALTKIDAITGQAVASFGTNGNATYQIEFGDTIDQTLMTMARRPAATPGPDLLYIGGTYKRAFNGDSEGYISAISPTTGVVQATQYVYYEDDNTGYKKDSVNAITVLANGKIAFAGSSDTDFLNVPATLVGRLDWTANAYFLYDPSFCGTGLCVRSNHSSFGSNFSNAIPVAIGERPGNRDLVISTQGNLFAIGSPQVIHIEQYGANGSTYHAGNYIAVTGTGSNDTTWAGPGLDVSDEFVTVTGTRLWGPTIDDDVDFVVGQLKANDSIFADQFGGPHSD